MSLQGSRIPHLARSILEKQISRRTWRESRDGPCRLFATRAPMSPNTVQAPRSPLRIPPRTPPTTSSRASRYTSPKTLILPNRRPDPEPDTRSEHAEKQQRQAHGADGSERKVRVMVISTSIFGAVLGVYVMMLYTAWNNEIRKHVLEGKELPQDADVSDRWKQLGRDYDEEVDWSEKFWFLNITGRRKKLAALAYGKVLEVSAGTGRNLEFYNLHPFDPTQRRQNLISSLTINDQSPIMIATAEKKYEDFHAQNKRPFEGEVDFVVGDAGLRGVIKRPEGGYDTIVQTMGLCSMVDPVSFLRTMGRLCRQPDEPSKSKDMQTQPDDGKGGRILLLEHGRSRYGMVNRILDSGASMHADHYGCWWNKDLAKIVQQSGLEVEKIKRYHWGTTWEIHLRPKQVHDGA